MELLVFDFRRLRLLIGGAQFVRAREGDGVFFEKKKFSHLNLTNPFHHNSTCPFEPLQTTCSPHPSLSICWLAGWLTGRLVSQKSEPPFSALTKLWAIKEAPTNKPLALIML